MPHLQGGVALRNSTHYRLHKSHSQGWEQVGGGKEEELMGASQKT